MSNQSGIADKVNAAAARGIKLLDQGNIDGAIAEYDNALSLKPDETLARYHRGYARRLRGDFDHAIDDFTAAIRNDPVFAEAIFNRGLAYRAKGERKMARADFEAVALTDTLAGEFATAQLRRMGRMRFRTSAALPAISNVAAALGIVAGLAASSSLLYSIGWPHGRVSKLEVGLLMLIVAGAGALAGFVVFYVVALLAYFLLRPFMVGSDPDERKRKAGQSAQQRRRPPVVRVNDGLYGGYAFAYLSDGTIQASFDQRVERFKKFDDFKRAAAQRASR